MNTVQVQDPATFGRVAVVMGGWSAERPVSLDSGKAVHAALVSKGVDAQQVDVDRRRLLDLAREGFDRVWLALHGPGGEDGIAQSALELQGLPYTGSGVLACALSMDKARCKALWAARGIPTPAHQLVDVAAQPAEIVDMLGLPLFVKPSHEGSSIGMSRVDRQDQLPAAIAEAARYDSEVLVEQFVDGPEYTAAIIEDRSLPLIHIETPRRFYDYEAKYAADNTLYHCPSGLDAEREASLQRLCRRAFDVIGGRGWGRLDFMLDRSGNPWFLEMNASPGMTSHSLVPTAAQAVGMDFGALAWRILESTLGGEESRC